MTDEPRSLEQFADEEKHAQFKENAEIARSLRATRAELSAVTSERDRLLQDLEIAKLIDQEVEILAPQPDWLKPKRRSGGKSTKRATLLAVLSDVHGGERIDVKEIGGYNAYNLDIADYRLRRYFEKVTMLARHYLAGVEYDGIVLALAGDMSSGDIHDELKETNELSTLETVLWLAPRIVAGIEQLASEFGKVHVVSAPGNHGRDSRLPRYKGRSSHNADTLLAKMVNEFFTIRNASPDVTFHIPKSIDADFEIYRFRFSVEHGDELQKTNPGTSEIGMLGPAKRGSLRKSRQRQEEGHPMDYLILGHFHQYVDAHEQGFIVNGSVKGYDEFARGLHLTPEPPQQALSVVTPEYGPQQAVSIRVSKRSEEGW